MPNTNDDSTDRLPRWQFRKKQKVEKRRKKRQEIAKTNKLSASVENVDQKESLAERQRYEREKQEWESREEKFKLIELAKKQAKEKEEKSKELSRKRWQETLMNLPMLPPKFTLTSNDNTKKDPAVPFRKFVQSTENEIQPQPKKTYRDRFLERKRAVKEKK
ncbi:MAG: hypothetical protein EXX96DRAFT_611997 [Benjaminiella poitrasii]|nr:MAG: hypothetical protein EXX96DRAFT_611997 [Benjaminiella poitrasii]